MSGLRINLGSGQRKFGEGWTNVDCQPKWKPDVVAEGSSMPMFTDNSAELIVMHHVLEHFGCGEGAACINECWRVLKQDGSLIITVPDMRALAKAWMSNKIDDQLYFTNIYGAYMGDEADRHKWGYTGHGLARWLAELKPWMNIKTFDFREIKGADVAKDWWILGVEAVK